ncbi:MAG: hypothetical protein H0X61_03265 [Acidimicrobiia bacterium]|nr:hypothetical protein [Acidimicrobiia bacterium]
MTLLVLAGCSDDSTSEPTTEFSSTSSATNPTSPSTAQVTATSAHPGTTAAELDRVEISLWHCGIEPIRHDRELWEVPDGEEPFDGTNVPNSVALSGTIERVSADELLYVDDSGISLQFVPDNGTEPICD